MVQFECRGLEPVDFQPQVRRKLPFPPHFAVQTKANVRAGFFFFSSSSSQAGFAAQGAETTSQFPEINLQEKVSQSLHLLRTSSCVCVCVCNSPSFCFRTGRTTTRKLLNQWASTKLHISLSSAESVGDGAQTLWLEGTFIKFNKNAFAVELCMDVFGKQARTFTT